MIINLTPQIRQNIYISSKVKDKPKKENQYFSNFQTCTNGLVNFSENKIIKAKRLLMPSLYKINNMKWAFAMNEVVESALNKLKTDPNLSAKSILEHMASEGRTKLLNLAPKNADINTSSYEKLRHAESFGIPREDPEGIVFVNSHKYNDYAPKVQQKITGNGDNVINIKYRHKGKELSLAQLSKGCPEYFSGLNSYDAILDTCYVEISETITNEVINEIFDQIKVLKRQIGSGMKNKDNKTLAETVDKIAEIYWLISQAWPYKRGSAALADMMTKVIFDWLNIKISPWKKDINPNIEALINPLDDFKNTYASLFIKKPSWAGNKKYQYSS